MPYIRRLCRHLAWIACLAVLLGALAPVASAWIEAQLPAPMRAAVCAGHDQPGPHNKGQGHHDGLQVASCSYCLAHVASLDLAVPGQWDLPVQAGSSPLGMVDGSPVRLIAPPYATAQSRAPPQV